MSSAAIRVFSGCAVRVIGLEGCGGTFRQLVKPSTEQAIEAYKDRNIDITFSVALLHSCYSVYRSVTVRLDGDLQYA